MPKRKLQHFAENALNPFVIEPPGDYPPPPFDLKGKWKSEFFKNNNPIVLELGCGKGEYTVGLAKAYPEKNCIGIDIKGARIWRGGTTLLEDKMTNGAFLRIQVDQLVSYFEPGEVDEIWVTFPDPQKERERKRLTCPMFLERYKKVLKPGGIVHLKTDSRELHEYTLEIIAEHKHKLHYANNDIYSGTLHDPVLAIKTFYEQRYLQQGKPITYLKFSFNSAE